MLLRILSAAALIPVVLAISWFGDWPLVLFIFVVQLLALWELNSLNCLKGNQDLREWILLPLLGTLLFAYLKLKIPVWIFPAGSFTLWMVFQIIRKRLPDGGLIEAAVFVFSMAYLVLPGWCWFQLRELENGFFLLILCYLGTWLPDTGGYFFGSVWGKHKITPLLSPKKSWEGLIGGLFITLLGLILWFKNSWFPAPAFWNYTVIVFYAILICIVGFVGDIFESMLKRDCGVKDSSSIIPGHGGVLDRMDSFYFNIVFTYLFTFLL